MFAFIASAFKQDNRPGGARPSRLGRDGRRVTSRFDREAASVDFYCQTDSHPSFMVSASSGAPEHQVAPVKFTSELTESLWQENRLNGVSCRTFITMRACVFVTPKDLFSINLPDRLDCPLFVRALQNKGFVLR